MPDRTSPHPPHRSLLRASASAAVLLAVSTLLPAQQTTPPTWLAERNARHGEEAIEALGNDLDAVARAQGVSAEELRSFLRQDDTLYVDGNGRLFYVDIPAADPDQSPAARGAGPIPLGDAFLLHSRPAANHVIYLDFTGHHSVNNDWGHNIVFPAFDTNGDPNTFSNGELSSIIAQWQYVMEDFAPFDVDVTTEDPGLARLVKSGGGDTQWGIRCLMTQATGGFGNGIGGVAFLNSFNDSIDNPVFVFNKGDNNGSMSASHEVGHSFGLHHDGLFGSSYHPGTGSGATSWGPIMGAPFGKSLVQWSNGDYPGSTTTENDFGLITQSAHGVTAVPDDAPGSLGAAAPVPLGCPDPSAGTFGGVIHSRTDVDAFRFYSQGGTLTVSAAPAMVGPNLDILLELYDGLGGLVASNNPTNGVSASLNTVLGVGDHVLLISGVDNPGLYSDYGSVGQYSLTVDLPLHSSFEDLGSSLAGTGGNAPALFATGFVCDGSLVSLSLSNGLPNTLGFLVYGLGRLNLPYKGGTLVPDLFGPGGLVLIATNASGVFSASAAWPPGLVTGQTIALQAWLLDAGGPAGMSASNAVEATAP